MAHTMFVCIGGTGTQIGTVIGNIYPLLENSGVSTNDTTYSMFILDKDTGGENFESCKNANIQYRKTHNALPFASLSPYELNTETYQELQREAGSLNVNYTVMDLIGNDPAMKALASMCWTDEKRNEDIRYGNNRDPSRGSIDAHVCLEKFDSGSLYKKLDRERKNSGVNNLRLVILGGITGGTGTALIVPFVKKIKSYPDFQELRIDIVILGPYFILPENPDKTKEVDNIGNTQDSFFRVKDQLEELEELVIAYPNDDWRIYYSAFPECDDICGAFSKNQAEKRKYHLLELYAALAVFKLASQDAGGGFFRTIGPCAQDGKIRNISWDEIPLGQKIKPALKNFLRLLSVIACDVYPSFTQDKERLVRDPYIKKYINKPINNLNRISNIAALIHEWLRNVIPYFDLWNEIQNFTKLGGNDGIVNFLPREDMNELDRILKALANAPRAAWNNDKPRNAIPLCNDTWMNYMPEIKPDKSKLSDDTAPEELFSGIIKDVYEVIAARKED